VIRFVRILAALGALSVGLSCASAPTSGPDAFPLDPREGLAGPFPAQVEKGWSELRQGKAAAAEAEFEAASRPTPKIAAEIGRVEALVVADRPRDALPLCRKLLSAGEPTVPLLVACGEAHSRSGDPVVAHTLYRQALARASNRPRLAARADELRSSARDWLVVAARAAAQDEKWKEARSEIARAIELAPDNSAVRRAAGEIEEAAGEAEKALSRYREAIELDSKDHEAAEKVGELALAVKDYALAVSIFDKLAGEDPRFAPRAEEARHAFRVANWPAPEREAAQSLKLTRAGAATLVWWMYPEIREARVSGGVIASDALSRRDSRAITRAVALGLLEVDRDTHRVNPAAHLGAVSASRLLLRLLLVVAPADRELPCLGGSRRVPRAAADSLAAAVGCGLLPEDEAGVISGPVFTKALDRVRALASPESEPGEQ